MRKVCSSKGLRRCTSLYAQSEYFSAVVAERLDQLHAPMPVSMPKKVRALALKHALSSKVKSGDLIVLDKAEAKDPKTAALRASFSKMDLSNALIIGGAELDNNFSPRCTQHSID